jgi:putative N6-adenine-specific DNA methylase
VVSAARAPRELAYRANLESRLASRVLWQVGHGRTATRTSSTRSRKGIDWERHFTAARTLRVDSQATRSPLTSLEFATLKMKDAVCDRFRADSGRRPSIDKERPDVRVHAYLTEREATLYLDTSGDALFKRGWRREADGAPLRENLAAGVLALRAGTPGTPLLDPDVRRRDDRDRGRLLKAADIAPGMHAAFGFQKLAWYDGPTWQRIPAARTRSRACARRACALRERQRSARGGAMPRNAAAAGVARGSRSARPTRSPRSAGAGGLLVANPPYGVRLEDGSAGRVLSEAWRCAEAALRRLDRVPPDGDTRLAKLIGLKPSKRTPLFNGAIECRPVPLRHRAGRPQRAPRDGRPSTPDDKIRVSIDPSAPQSPPMPMLPARHYESDHTRFIREMKERQAGPRARAAREPRDLVGQAPADLARQKTMDEGRVPQTPYVYQDAGLAPVRTCTPTAPASSRWSAPWRASSSTIRSSSTRARRCRPRSSSSCAG